MNSKNREHVKLLIDGVARTISGGHSMAESAGGLARGLELLLVILRGFDSDDKLDAQLSAMPNLSAAQFQVLGGLATALPAAVSELLRDGLETATEAMPHGKTGPKIISTLEKVSICQQVTALIGAGCTTGAAMERVSLRTGRSTRSVRRIWAERSKLQSAFTVDEVKTGMLRLLLGDAVDASMLNRFTAAAHVADSDIPE